jgi:hypothetical protein
MSLKFSCFLFLFLGDFFQRFFIGYQKNINKITELPTKKYKKSVNILNCPSFDQRLTKRRHGLFQIYNLNQIYESSSSFSSMTKGLREPALE